MRVLLPAVALVLAASAAASAAERHLPFQLEAGGIVVPVTVGGRGPYRFVIDTGSSRSLVSARLARRLRLDQGGTTLVITPAGRSARPLARLEDLDLGLPEPVSLVAAVLADHSFRVAGTDGVIGRDVLGREAYTIDYQARRIVWRPTTPDTANGNRLTLEFDGTRLLVSLPQPGGRCRTLRLVPDSGADGLVLFEGTGRPLPEFTPLGTTGLQTATGLRVVRRVLVDDLHLGDLRLRNHAAVLVPAAASAEMGDASAEMGDGLLPLHLFERVTFNGPERYLVLEGR